jgi:hypothetical protein
LGELVGSYSPRDKRVDDDHVLALAEVLDRVPPVVVDKATMKVIDGVHRVEASRRMGRAEIRAVFFEGSETDALVVAVQANIRHGKPLSRGERQAAAGALLRRCPERSDLAEEPGSSFREAAEAAGVALSTVHRTVTGARRLRAGIPERAGSSPPVLPLEDIADLHPEAVPLGRIYEVADELRRRARTCLELAEALERRARACRQARSGSELAGLADDDAFETVTEARETSRRG